MVKTKWIKKIGILLINHTQKMRIKILTYICCVVMLFVGVSVFAQKDLQEPPSNRNNDLPPPGLPIDGGLSYLLLAGAAYGVYAIRKRVKD